MQLHVEHIETHNGHNPAFKITFYFREWAPNELTLINHYGAPELAQLLNINVDQRVILVTQLVHHTHSKTFSDVREALEFEEHLQEVCQQAIIYIALCDAFAKQQPEPKIYTIEQVLGDD